MEVIFPGMAIGRFQASQAVSTRLAAAQRPEAGAESVSGWIFSVCTEMLAPPKAGPGTAGILPARFHKARCR